jgi:hypothetical protein
MAVTKISSVSVRTLNLEVLERFELLPWAEA